MSVRVCSLPFPSDAWDAIAAADDKATAMEEAIASGQATVVDEPRVAVREGKEGKVLVSTEIPYFRWDPVEQDYDVDMLPLENRLTATAAILPEGVISVDIEYANAQVLAFTQGPHDETVPIISEWTLKAQVFARQGEPTVIDGLAHMVDSDSGQPKVVGGLAQMVPADAERERGKRPAAILVLVTASVLDPWALPAHLHELFGAAPDRKTHAELTACLYNMRMLCNAARLYAADWDGILPGADWMEDVEPYHGSRMPCPAKEEDQAYGYVYNAKLLGARLDDITDPARTVLFFEGDADGGPPVGEMEALVTEPRHGEKIVAGFADGHSEALTREELDKLLERDPFEPVPENPDRQ